MRYWILWKSKDFDNVAVFWWAQLLTLWWSREYVSSMVGVWWDPFTDYD